MALMSDSKFAPSTAGMERKNEKRTANVRSNPRSSPAEIVVPDRDRPGTTAIICAKPMTIASESVMAFSVLLPWPKRSAASSRKPVTMSAKPMKNVL